MFSFEQGGERPRTPPAIQALAVLLVLGGVFTAGYGIVGLATGTPGELGRSGVNLLLGLLCLGIARAVQQRGRRWTQVVILALCAAGFALGGYRMVTSPGMPAANDILWALIYAVLAGTPAARAWFRGDPARSAEG